LFAGGIMSLIFDVLFGVCSKSSSTIRNSLSTSICWNLYEIVL